MAYSVKHELVSLSEEHLFVFSLMKGHLSETLKMHIEPSELCSKVKSCQSLMAGIGSLNLEEKLECCPESSKLPDYKTFGVKLLYKLIKNLCPSIKPTEGWGKKPKPTNTELGDDIERVMLFREELSKNVSSSEFDPKEFEELLDELKNICKRIRSKIERLRTKMKTPVVVESSIFEKNSSILHFISGYKDDEIITKVFICGDSKEEDKAKKDFKEACDPKETHIEYINVDKKSEEIMKEAKELEQKENENEIDEEKRLKLEKVIERNEENIFESYSTVIGLGISSVRCNGKKILPEPCIVVYCLDKNIVPFGEKPLPISIDGFDCDHREDFMRFSTCATTAAHTNIELGCSIGIDEINGAGSAGFLAESARNECGFLTAAHVAISDHYQLYVSKSLLSDPSNHNDNERVIVHPSFLDAPTANQKVGKVTEAFIGNYKDKGLDFAFVQSYIQRKEEKENLTVVMEADLDPFGSWKQWKVTKTGRSTKKTSGHVHDRNFSVGVPHRGYTYYFRKCYGIKLDPDTDTDADVFEDKGDSGSGVFLNVNGSSKPLGIIIGSSEMMTIVCQIDKIVNDLSLQIINYR